MKGKRRKVGDITLGELFPISPEEAGAVLAEAYRIVTEGAGEDAEAIPEQDWEQGRQTARRKGRPAATPGE